MCECPVPPPAPSIAPLLVTDYTMVAGSPAVSKRQAEVNWRRGRSSDLGFNYTMNDGLTQLSLDQNLGRETRGEGTGGTVWDAAMVMGKYLEIHAGRFDTSRVIELGSGTGFMSMVFLAIPEHSRKRIDVTDLSKCLPLMRENVSRNTPAVAALSGANVQEYCWGSSPVDSGLGTDYSLILVSDCVFDPAPIDSLVESLSLLSEANPKVEILLSMEHRTHKAELKFWELLRRDHWEVETIREGDMGLFKASDIDIYVLTKALVSSPR